MKVKDKEAIRERKRLRKGKGGGPCVVCSEPGTMALGNYKWACEKHVEWAKRRIQK